MMRLDRYIAETTELSRSQAAKAIRSGRVTLNGAAVRIPDQKLDEQTAEVRCCGQLCVYRRFCYYLLNKPTGVITASRDPKQKTVLDLFPPEILKRGIFPVGRLDKDTSGLLLLTNDGIFAHRVISPASGIDKVYAATVEGTPTEDDAARFHDGLALADGTRCLPAELTAIGENRCLVTVREGKYHQVRRMLSAVGKPVQTLHRVSLGGIELDPSLEPGQFRELTTSELCILFKLLHMEK